MIYVALYRDEFANVIDRQHILAQDYLLSSSRDRTVDGNIVLVRRSVTQKRNSDIGRLTLEVSGSHTIRHENQVGFLPLNE